MCFIVILCILCAQSTLNAAPALTCPNPTFNFGTTNSTATIKHTFKLENTGDQTLNITSVKCCCSAKCSKPRKKLLPGEKTSFDIVLSLKGRRGKMKKRLYVRSNDPKKIILPLTITGTVLDPGRTSGTILPKEGKSK